MATRNIVPRGDGEGSVGTSAKKWDAIWANKINNTNTADLIANTQSNYRQADTTYTLGTIKYHHSLPTDYYLECTTQGTTSSGDLSISSTTIGDTVTDGTVTWTINKEIGTGNAPVYAGYNQKQTFTSSGSFTAPITGLYKVTLQGGGGGGADPDIATATTVYAGGGGGSGAHIVTYEKLVAGTAYNFVIGAGGVGITANKSGNDGGDSSITINGNAYVAGGGSGGSSSVGHARGGFYGFATLNGVAVPEWSGFNGISGSVCTRNVDNPSNGGLGGGPGGGHWSGARAAVAGGGGAGRLFVTGTSTYDGSSQDGGDGYIEFEWLDTSLL